MYRAPLDEGRLPFCTVRFCPYRDSPHRSENRRGVMAARPSYRRYAAMAAADVIVLLVAHPTKMLERELFGAHRSQTLAVVRTLLNPCCVPFPGPVRGFLSLRLPIRPPRDSRTQTGAVAEARVGPRRGRQARGPHQPRAAAAPLQVRPAMHAFGPVRMSMGVQKTHGMSVCSYARTRVGPG